MNNDENRIEKFLPSGGSTGLQINITHQDKNVQLVFDKPVMILTITPEQALGMAMAILGQVGHTTFGPAPPLSPV